MVWGVFNAAPPPPLPVTRIVHDGNDSFEVDKEYAELGEREGWLEYMGCYQVNGQMLYNFAYLK